MKIRSQISLYLTPFILIVVCAIFLLNYGLVRHSLTDKAMEDLRTIEENTHQAAQTLLSTAINNYLRGITDKNIEFIGIIYTQYRQGKLSESQAKDQIQNYFNQQSVGVSGYLVAVQELDGKLYLDRHPFLPNQECTETEGCQEWASTRNGYTEYDWKNPADNTFRKKAAYVREFPAWNWIVGASSYRDEFVKLVNVDDLRKLIAPIRINQNGYFVVLDADFTVLIHPEFTTIGHAELVNSKGENIIDMLKESPDGYITYTWRNPSDQEDQLKYAFIDKLEGYNWYLVATGYLSEVYRPIVLLRNMTIIMAILAGVTLMVIIYRLSKNISTPLLMLEQDVVRFYEEKKPFAWPKHPIEEIDVLGNAFSRMSTELTRSINALHTKNAELAVSEREKEEHRILLDGIINSMPSIIIGVDEQILVTKWNRQAEQATGLSQEAVQGISLFEVFKDLAAHQELLRESITGNKVRTIAHAHPNADGTVIYFEVTIYPLFAPHNAGAVIRIDEVTDRVVMEERLRQSQKMDAVGQLAGGVAHDFNNLLTGIVGAAELLRLKVRPEEQGLVKIVRESSARASELIKKLLAFSRKERIAFTPVDMHRIIRDSIEILERSLDKRITIAADLDAESGMVMGDWSQLQNSLLNIGINAGHAMPDGGELHFTTSIVTLDDMYCSQSPFALSAGRYLQIAIRDTGSGIAREHIRHIFEPFFTTKEQNDGTGLGLAAVYGAMQQHNGAVSVYSELDVGTEFKLILPLTRATPHAPTAEESVVPGEGCILVIDDEAVVRMTACMMLEKLGYSTLEAVNGLEGVNLYRQHQTEIDLVVLDMLMPVMDGTECFHQLKSINPSIRVIISSGFTRDADLGNLREKGLCNFVRKPYNMIDLSRAIAEAMAISPES